MVGRGELLRCTLLLNDCACMRACMRVLVCVLARVCIRALAEWRRPRESEEEEMLSLSQQSHLSFAC